MSSPGAPSAPAFGPGATIAILGGGQLGRMIGVAARQLGYGVVVVTPPGDAPAAAVADQVIRAEYEDPAALAALARVAQVATYEFENVPAAAVEALEALLPVRPSSALLGYTQDRLSEHALLDRLGIGHAPGVPVHTEADLVAGLATLGRPCRLKTARGGYDGGGQWRIRDDAGEASALAVVRGAGGRAFRLEREVRFDAEVSVIVTRGVDGAERVFPLFENEHRDGILWLTRAPARVSPTVAARARAIARAIADEVRLCGTLTVECFVSGDDVFVNELAPRVHNSGHLTIEACGVSQFEQHVRAVCGLPLAEPVLRAPAAMANILGDAAGALPVRGCEVGLASAETHLHLYGKAEVRVRRKMGHVTALGDTLEIAVERATRAAEAVRWG